MILMPIAIDLGHGVGQDRGAEGIVTEESIINAVGALVIAKLKALGHSVLEVRPSQANSVSDSLIKRVDLANAHSIDLFVSIHANAGEGVGAEIFTYRGTELDQARVVLNNLEDLGFIKVDAKGNKISRGIKSSNLYVINQTETKAMLIEICFVDTKSDVDLYNKLGPEPIANAIVEGLVGDKIIASTPIPMYTEPSPASVIIDSWIGKLQVECNNQGFSSQVVDGVPGPATLRGCPTIKYGASGDITKLLQQRLVDLGYNTNGVDGLFGNGTRNAVVQFQNTNGLVADGIVGNNTWRKLLGL